MPAPAIADICSRLKQAQQLLRDPNNWKEANERIDEARDLLKPIRYQNPTTLAAWAALTEIAELLPLRSSDPEWAIDIAKGYLNLAIRELCSEEKK